MESINEMLEYIDRTNIPDRIRETYCLNSSDIFLFYDDYSKSSDFFGVIVMAFNFGMARGWRACKAQQKKRAESRRVS